MSAVGSTATLVRHVRSVRVRSRAHSTSGPGPPRHSASAVSTSAWWATIRASSVSAASARSSASSARDSAAALLASAAAAASRAVDRSLSAAVRACSASVGPLARRGCVVGGLGQIGGEGGFLLRRRLGGGIHGVGLLARLAELRGQPSRASAEPDRGDDGEGEADREDGDHPSNSTEGPGATGSDLVEVVSVAALAGETRWRVNRWCRGPVRRRRPASRPGVRTRRTR